MNNPLTILKNKWKSIAYLNKGIDYIEQDLYELSIKNFDKALSLNPKYSRALVNKAYSLSELNRPEEAIHCYDQAIKYKPKYEKAWYDKGYTLYELKRYKEAFDCFDKLTKINPKNKLAWQNKGIILFNQFNNYEETILCCDKTIKLDPQIKSAWFYKGSALLELKKFKESIIYFDELIKLNTKDDEGLNYEPWRKKALAYANLQCKAETIDCIHNAIDCLKRSHISKSPAKIETADQFLSSFWSTYDLYHKSIECYDDILKIDPYNEIIFQNKIFALEKIYKHEEAMECLNNAIAANQNSAFLWDLKGYILYEHHCYEDSIECYDKLFAADPNYKNIFYSKGSALFGLKRFEEAIECFDKSIDFDPRNENAWYKKGGALFLLGRFEEALKCYDKLTEMDTQSEEIWHYKGWVLEKLGRDTESLICFDEALALDPNYRQAIFMKGFVLLKLTRNDEAIEYFDKAISLDINNEDAWYEKGFSLYGMGSYEEAIHCYDEAIKINPNNTDFWLYKGLSLYALEYYDKAIECVDKVIELTSASQPASVSDNGIPSEKNENRFFVYNGVYLLKGRILFEQNKDEEALEILDKLKLNNEYAMGLCGSILYKMKKFEEAIECFKKSEEMNDNYPEFPEACIFIGNALLKLGKTQEAVNYINQSKKDILNILIELDWEDRDNISSYLKPVLDNDAFFNEITKNISDNLEDYKEVYIISMLIISELRISRERFVSHYTKTKTMEDMLIKDSKFRLSAMDNTCEYNDKREGLTLLDYLFGKEQTEEIIKGENHTAFAGCFTFNHDNLNQFRLYGKEDGRECTGVSIVLRNSFFNKKSKTFTWQITENFSKWRAENEKHSFFRCIYLDPVSGHINSIGCKEEYLFYRKSKDEKEDFIDDINEYKKNINETIKYIETKMEELKNKINGLSPTIVSKLLLNLRYLTKHIGFNEERECRIVKILHSDNNKILTDEITGKKYIEYINIKPHVKKIYFGPKAENMESYQNKIQGKKLPIACVKSEHPFG